MISRIASLGDRLLARFVPRTEASASGCYYTGIWSGCPGTPNPCLTTEYWCCSPGSYCYWTQCTYNCA